ncbi:hypothetical protein J7I98_29960 [Streptomyces sp. ISL-98]|uniref:hypothetical protein n=1 Tax=Streptomyces sp. ISL-98 TaxID=2819192 RepID=UPI001BE72BCF|nr:hypothetical protein [Streptomyces sp. ISL-98]MBT2510014.1 hypothetical protein [Streptomyces sp. ISL-98]
MPSRPTYKTPECRADACELCHGPGDVRLPGIALPVETLRCDCDCHRRPPD